jgi:hypothetical protein
MRATLAFLAGSVISATALAGTPAGGVTSVSPAGVHDASRRPPATAPVPTALASGLSTLAVMAVYNIRRRMARRRAGE